MSISRRALYEAGEPFGDSCTVKKVGGGRIYGGGGGGGSTTQVVDVPEWAKPYAKDVLARSSAMTMPGEEGVSEAPKYVNNRVAGLQPLGVMAKEAGASLTTAPQLGMATGLAGQAGQYGLGAEQAYRNLSAGDISGLRGAGAQLGQQLQPGIQYGMGAGARLGQQLQPGIQYGMGAGERLEGKIDPALQESLRAGRAYQQMATDPRAMQAYMSPYMQNVVDIERREAQRQADIAATGRGAQAVRAGAFGGSRQAIIEAEAQRNLSQQMGDIQSRGLQSAFERAQQAQQFGSELGLRGLGQGLQAQQAASQLGLSGVGQSMQAQQAAAQLGLSGVGQSMQAQQAAADLGLRGTQAALAGTQFGSTLGMQGAQLANQAAQNLGQLGATQFGQQKDIIGIQRDLGKDEQALEQARLDIAYQDWVDAQKYPYQQLGFMADMLRGVPVGQTATTIGPAPNPVSQALGLAGTAYYGSKAFGSAAGGSVPGYAAGGGISGLNPVQRDVALEGMGDQQMQGLMGLADISQLAKLQVAEKLQQNAQIRKAAEMAQAGQQPQPQTSVAQEALMEMGLGGLDVPEDMVSAAGGGIMRFAEGTDEEGIPESGTVLTEEQRAELTKRYPSDNKPLTQEEMDEAALKRAEVDGKAPGVDYGRPQYTAGTAPTFTSPYTAEDYMSMRKEAMAPGMAQIEQGFAEEQAANQALINEIKKAETQRQADVKAAGEYGVAQEERAKERLEGIKGRKEDAKLNFIRDISVGLLTSSTGNFLTDLGVAVGKGGKAYDTAVARIDTAKEKLQDSIDTIMEQRRGETIANASDRRKAAVDLAKAQSDLAKLLAGKKTKFGEMSIGDAKDAVNTATSISMKTAERQHAAALSQYEAGERGRLEMAKPEGRDALQARITSMLASSDPAVRAQGRRLRDEAAKVTEAFTYKTPPGQVTPAIDLNLRQKISDKVNEDAGKLLNPFGKSLKGLSQEDRAAAIQAEIDRRYKALIQSAGGAGAGAPTGGKVDPNNRLLK